MRVGIDATILEDDKPTGIGLFTINLINSLAKEDTNILVWTINAELINNNVEKRLVLGKFKNCKYCYLIRFFWSQTVLPFLIKKERIDIFLSPIPQGIIKCPVRQVVIFHDLLPLIYPQDFPLHTRISFKYILPQIIRSSDLILSVSEQTKKDIIHLYHVSKYKVKVIEECLDFDFFNKSFNGNITRQVLDKYRLKYKKYLLFVGTLTYRKNLHTLIKAFKNIISDFSDLRLVIVGKLIDNEYYTYINNLITKHNLLSYVSFLGYISYEELLYLYYGAKVFIYPSLYEGFGLPIIEAIYCRTPVIASKNVPSAQVIKDIPTFPPEDEDKLSDILKKVLRSNFLIPKKEIDKIKDRFSYKSFANKIIKEIKGLYG